MEKLNADELAMVKYSLGIHINSCKAFKKGSYGDFNSEAHKNVDRKLATLEKIVKKLG